MAENVCQKGDDDLRISHCVLDLFSNNFKVEALPCGDGDSFCVAESLGSAHDSAKGKCVVLPCLNIAGSSC